MDNMSPSRVLIGRGIFDTFNVSNCIFYVIIGLILLRPFPQLKFLRDRDCLLPEFVFRVWII